MKKFTVQPKSITASQELKPFVALIGYDFGDEEYGPKFSYEEERVYAENAEEAERMIDAKYGYIATGDPYEGCSISPATPEDIEHFKNRGNEYNDVEFPFEI